MGMPGEVVGVRANGEEFPIEASISRVNLGNEMVLTVILRDISERKRATAQREQLESQLRQSKSCKVWVRSPGASRTTSITFLRRSAGMPDGAA